MRKSLEEIQNNQIRSERKEIIGERVKENIIQNRRIKYDMHNTKEIENKNDGIDEKIFTNCKKDRMEKKYKKTHTNTKVEGWVQSAFGF